MDENLKQLLAGVREEAVVSAKREADAVVAKAREQAGHILSEANEEVERTREEARLETAMLQASAADAIRRAARDAKLTLVNQLRELLHRIVHDHVHEALNIEVLQRMILLLVSKWDEVGERPTIEVSVSDQDMQSLEDSFLTTLRDTVKSDVVFQAIPELRAGLRIGDRNGEAFYDFSDEAITEFLCRNLAHRFTDLVRDSHTDDDKSTEESS